MAMGKRGQPGQGQFWIPTEQLPTAASHPFYEQLNRILDKNGFDGFAEDLCTRFYHERMGRPSLAPARYFRLLLIGYFEGIDSERGIAWRVADSLGLRRFLGYRLTDSTPDHSTISRNRRLIDLDFIVISCGGGGIPVYQDVGGYLRGVEAVIDKDYVASILARDLDADLFIILTQVPMVAENFGRPNQRWLRTLPMSRAREMLDQNQFPPGSMGPKIRAAIEFVEATGKEVLITDEESLKRALKREAGTFLVADGDVEYAPDTLLD